MARFALIGNNIAFSKSKVLHETIGQMNHHEVHYDILDMEVAGIEHTLTKLKSGFYQMLNVTTPYKEVIIGYLDELVGYAKELKVVNTIIYKDNKLIGYNTDYNGFVALLEATTFNFSEHPHSVCVFGTGPSAKTINLVFHHLGIEPTFVTRMIKEQSFSKLIDYHDDLSDFDVYVNSTPVGSATNLGSPVDPRVADGKIVIDLNYNPKETLLMSHARISYNGAIMLVEQAQAAQNIYFGSNVVLSPQQIKKLVEIIYE